MEIQSNNNQGVNKFYIYAHYTLDDKIFYIGKGTIKCFKTKSLKRKYSRAYHFSNRNRFWTNIYNKHGIKVKILYHFNNEQDCLKKEQELILKLGRRYLKEGILSNISIGGEIGPIGVKFKMSEKQKQFLSDLKSIYLYVYDKQGNFIKKIKTIKETAKFCGVTYNAIHSCMKTKNYSNGFFIFKNYQEEKLDYTYENLNFKHTLSKIVITEDLNKNILEHPSVYDAAKYLNTDRKNLKKAITNNRLCKKHKVYFKDNQQGSS